MNTETAIEMIERGETDATIAAALGMTVDAVSAIRTQAEVQARVERESLPTTFPEA
jgi:predicted transcriptional regulator